MPYRSAPALTRSLAGVVAALLASCTVGPDFSSPASPETKSYTGETETFAPGKGEVAQHFTPGENITADWWAVFHSKTLDETLRQAIGDNHTLAAARATLLQAREAVIQAGGALYPQVSFGASATRERSNLATLGNSEPVGEFNLFSLGPTVSYSLDPFGGNRRQIEEERALAEGQDYELDAAYLTLTGNAVAEAVNVASLRAQIRTIEDIVADDQRNVSLVGNEAKAGELTRIDLQSAMSQLASDQAFLPPLQQQLSQAKDALSLLVGKAPADWTVPDFDLDALALPQDLPLALPSDLVHQRPDVLSSEAHLHAASAAIGVATAALYPNITLSGGMAQQALSLGHLFLPAANIWSLAGGLTAPIFEGGALEAQRNGTKHAFDAALENYEQTVLQSFTQVADVLHAMAHDADLVRDERNAADAAAESLRLSREAFPYGSVTLLQILDAERESEQARLGYVRAKAQRYADTAQLFVAMGGGWRAWRAQTEAMDKPRGETPSKPRS